MQIHDVVRGLFAMAAVAVAIFHAGKAVRALLTGQALYGRRRLHRRTVHRNAEAGRFFLQLALHVAASAIAFIISIWIMTRWMNPVP